MELKKLIETIPNMESMTPAIFSPITLLFTTTGARPMVTFYKEDLGLYWATRTGTDKLEQLKASKRVVAYFGKLVTHKYLEAVLDVEISTDAADKASAWNDSFKDYGFTGPEDASLVILKAHPVSASIMNGEKPTKPSAHDMYQVMKKRYTF